MIKDFLLNKTAKEKAQLKAIEIAKFDFAGKYKNGDLEIEIQELKTIAINNAHGVEIFARAWKNGKQLGFGKDGSVDIERFRIWNPPIMVPDGTKKIIQHEIVKNVFIDVEVDNFKEDLVSATREALVSIIKTVGKENAEIIKDKIGNTTDTFYPVAGTGTAPMDAMIGRSGVSQSFTDIRAGAGNDIDATSATVTFAQLYPDVNPNWGYLKSGGFGFDTSSLPDTDVIDSATFSLYITATPVTGAGDTDVDLVNFTPADGANFAAGDRANMGTTREATGIALSAMSASAYTDWTLNATGLAYISKVAATYFATRTKWDVDNNFTGAWNANGTYGLCAMSDTAGTTQDPKLVVVHSVASSFPKNIIITQAINRASTY